MSAYVVPMKSCAERKRMSRQDLIDLEEEHECSPEMVTEERAAEGCQ